jgi:dolichol-phosphate mannosyltransferase
MDGPHRAAGSAGWSLSLIIPAYNEEAGISQAVAEADDALARLGCAYEVLVVDDGSRDGTARAVEEAAGARPHVRLLRHPENRGYGAALRTGFEAARCERVAFTDADCQFHLDDLAFLVPLTARYPLAVGYRVRRQDPWQRRFFSWGYNVMARTLLGTRVRDCDCALKVFRKDALGRLLPEARGFFVNTEMLARARMLGYDVGEVGVRHRRRLRGVSKVSLADIPRTLGALLPFWWSRVLFPGRPSPSTSATEGGVARNARQPALLFGLLLAVVAGLLFFTRLGSPLLEPEETRYAEIPRQMLAEGSFVVPVLHGQPYLHKPPLLYWLVMASYSLFGVEDWAARLVPAGAAVLLVLVTYLWGKRAVGARAAFAGALILCLSARFVYLGRMLTLDSLLSLWVVAALAAAHVAVGGPRLRRGWWLLSAGACGLGLLTKGPVALVLVAAPVVAFTALDRRAARPGLKGWAVYLAAALGLAAPWYLCVAAADPGAVGSFLWTHHVLRYVAPLDHAKPFWFYLPGLLLGMLPWTLLLPPLARFLGRRSAAAAARRPPALGFFLLAFLWCLLFFSTSGCKRGGYLLPAFPPLALALGCYLDTLLPRRPLSALRRSTWGAVRLGPRLAHRATLLALAVGVAAGVLAVSTGLWKPAGGVVLAGLATAGLAVAVRHGPRRLASGWWAVCGATTFALLFVGVHQLLPAYNRKFAHRGQVRRHLALCADPGLPVICYPHHWDSVSFYLRRNDVRAYSPAQRRQLIADLKARPRALLFVKTDKQYLKELLRDLPAALEFVPRGRQGTVTVGLVRPRAEVPEVMFARR